MADDRDKRKKRRLRKFFSLTEEGATPVKWSIIFVVVFTLFGGCYSITFLFPFLPEMVLFFGYKEEDKGYYAGLIASSMFAGRAVGSYFWGWLCDKIGRRPVVLVCLVGIAISNITFGFSTSIVLALISRFANGLFNGLVGVCKTVLYETSDNTNQAVGMSFIGFGWGAGVVIGPLISGYIASPAKRYPNVFAEDGFFGDFPFLLPSLCAGIIAAIVFVLDIFIFPETLTYKNTANNKKSDDMENDLAPERNITATSPQLSQRHLALPATANIYGSMASFDIQLNTPICYRAKPSFNTNVLYRNDSGKSPGLQKARSIVDMMMTVDEDAEHVESYPLTKRRTSISMQHIPSSSLLKELAENDKLESVFDENEEKINVEKGNKTIKDTDEVSENTDCYIENQESESESNAILESESREGKGKNPTVTLVPQTKITVSDTSTRIVEDAMEIQGKVTDEDVEIKTIKSRDGCLKKIKKLRFVKLMGLREVQYSVFLYTFYSFAVIGLEEVFTVWASTEIHLEKIGAAIGMPAIPLMVLQIFIYPKIASKIGNIPTFQLFMTYLIFSTPLLPALRAIHDKPTALWAVMITMQMVQKMSFTSCFTSCSILINNSIEPELAGSVNGIAMTLTAISRTLAPTCGGIVFTWSLSSGRHIGYPFDVNLVFLMFAVVFLTSNILSVFMPRNLEKQKKT